jgi:hypothetical protein
MKKDSMSN